MLLCRGRMNLYKCPNPQTRSARAVIRRDTISTASPSPRSSGKKTLTPPAPKNRHVVSQCTSVFLPLNPFHIQLAGLGIASVNDPSRSLVYQAIKESLYSCSTTITIGWNHRAPKCNGTTVHPNRSPITKHPPQAPSPTPSTFNDCPTGKPAMPVPPSQRYLHRRIRAFTDPSSPAASA